MTGALPRLLIATGLAATLAAGRLAAADLSVAELAVHLASPRPAERLAALSALEGVRSAAASAAALAGLRVHPQLQPAECEQLARVLAVQDIAQSVALLRAPEPGVVRAAIQDLGSRKAADLLPVLKSLLEQPDQVANAKEILAVAMRQEEQGQARADLLLLQFQDGNEFKRQEAVRALIGSGALTEAAAHAIAGDPAPGVRQALIEVLLASQTRAPAGGTPRPVWPLELLRTLYGDAVASVRASALSALMSVAAQHWPASLSKEELELFLAAFADGDKQVRYVAIDFFRTHREEAAVAALERACGDPEGVNAAVALEAVRGFGLPSAAQLAFQACSLPHPQARMEGLLVLRQLHDPRLAQVAARLLDDPDYRVRSDAQRALHEDASGGEKVGLELGAVALLKPADRLGMLARLAQLDPAARLAHITALFQGMAPEQRLELMRRCTRDRELAFSEGEFLVARARDADPRIAATAFEALRYANRPGHLLGLAEALERATDPDPRVAAAAGACLAGSLPSDASAGSMAFHVVQALRAADQPVGAPAVEVAAACAAALAAPAGEKGRHFDLLAGIDDERALRLLQEAARSAERSIRWAALAALVRRGDQSDATLDFALARILTAPPADLQVRVLWPAMTGRLLVRLATFDGVAEREAVARVRAEIERRLALVASQEPLR